MKPHVLCHMMSPLDGRLKVAEWTAKSDFQPFVDEYERIHDAYKYDAWLAGRSTGEEFADGRYEATGKSPANKPKRPVHVSKKGADEYGIILDTHGNLRWKKNTANGAHLIAVVGSGIADEYLASIAEAGGSYIVSSKSEIDPAEVLDVLAREFGIETLLLEGGATVNGSFFKAKLVDEVSYVLFPSIGGRSGTPAIFEAGDDGLAELVQLELKGFEGVGSGGIHARYTVSYRG